MAPSRTDVQLIGLDLDNTVIDYGPAYRALAADLGLAPEFAERATIRGTLRRSADDDEEWQRFQAVLYTDGLDLARPAAGLFDALAACSERGVRVFIASHKTPKGPDRFGGRDLRGPAMAWLDRHAIVPGYLNRESVSFHSTAAAKVAHVAQARPSLFMDDLPEILAHPHFPADVERVLYREAADWTPRDDGSWTAGFPALTDWLMS